MATTPLHKTIITFKSVSYYDFHRISFRKVQLLPIIAKSTINMDHLVPTILFNMGCEIQHLPTRFKVLGYPKVEHSRQKCSLTSQVGWIYRRVNSPWVGLSMLWLEHAIIVVWLGFSLFITTLLHKLYDWITKETNSMLLFKFGFCYNNF